MTRRLVTRRCGLVLVIGGLIAATPAAATDMDWWTVDGGGGRCAGSGFALTGTVGQPDAGQPASGGSFTWNGGLWVGEVSPTEPPLFADDFETGDLSRWSSSTGGAGSMAPTDRGVEGSAE